MDGNDILLGFCVLFSILFVFKDSLWILFKLRLLALYMWLGSEAFLNRALANNDGEALKFFRDFQYHPRIHLMYGEVIREPERQTWCPWPEVKTGLQLERQKLVPLLPELQGLVMAYDDTLD